MFIFKKVDGNPPVADVMEDKYSFAQSPVKLAYTLVVIIFASEVISMSLLYYFFPEQTFLFKTFVDATVLLLLVSTAAYYIIFRPFASRFKEGRKAEEALRALSTTFSAMSGEEFFNKMARHLAVTLDMEYALIGELMGNKSRVKVVGGFGNGQALKPFEYDLKDTPCDNVIGKARCFYPSNVQKQFPRDHLLTEMGIEGYIGSPLFDRSGKPLGIIVLLDTKPIVSQESAKSLLDIFTEKVSVEIERRRAEEALRESEERFRGLAEDAPIAISIISRNGNIEYVNKKYSDITGYSHGDISTLERWWSLAYQDGEQRRNIIDEWNTLVDNRSARREKTGIKERSITCKDGSVKDVELRITPAMDKIMVVFYDITERKTAEEERKSLEAQLMHSQKIEAVGRLAGGIAHDFNNILSAIIANGSLLSMNIKKDDPSTEFIDEILSLSERAATLTKGLLAFSRKQIIDLKPIKVNDVIKNTEKILSRLIGEDIELRTELSDDDPIILADSVQMEQILMNFATNARDAMPEGGTLTIGTERTEMDDEFIQAHGFGEPGFYVVITMTDTGIGMDEDTKERIFEPFFTTKDTGKGTGLGLSTIYGIVKQHKGYIIVSGDPGMGTIFKIYLPLTDDEVSDIRTSVHAIKSDICTETILLAEDEKSVRKSLKEILNTFGYQVIEAVNGEDAVDKFRENQDNIDLLIFDVIMPKKNGKEAYDEIKWIRPDAKALFISGYTEDVMHKKGVHEEGLHFMYKPFSPGQIFRAIKEVLVK